ncbi:MAG: molybdate ABC transporter substrate-binding protein [Hydrogenobaculum sp.]
MKKFIVFGLLASKIVFGATITVAAAADLRFVLQDLTALYEEEYPQDKLKFIYGASGNFYNQIRAGYPIDVFMSADTHFPELLYKKGLSYKPRAYAVGKLALFTTKNIDVDNPKLALLQAKK